MKLMLIEDDTFKSNAIKKYLLANGIDSNDIIHAKNMTDFAANLHYDIGLFIIDLKLPSIDKGTASQNGTAILESIVKAGKDNSLLLAISSYPGDFDGLREYFESHGCILADFSKKNLWQSALGHLLIQLKKNIKFDFLIFCALQEERNPYVVLTPGKQVIRSGINCLDIEVGGKKGSIILLSQMGLVNAAVTASLCIERYKPSVVAMSGICGGFKDRAQLGQLFISSMAYEYQSGKWTSDGFKQEPYQVTTESITLTNLQALIESENLIEKLEIGFKGARPTKAHKPSIGIFTSGSAVIADESLLKQIEVIHRKVNALDMEVFALKRAAELSPYKPKCICAKTVVDLCNEVKDDKIYAYGSYISAQFILKALPNYFSHS